MHLAAGREPGRAVPSLIRSVPAANVRSTRFDILHVNGEVSALLCLPALACRPSVVTLHGLNLVRRSSGASARVAAANLRLLVRAASRTICVSAAERDEVMAIVGRRQADRLLLIPYGIEMPDAPREKERTAVRAELGIADEVVFVWVGALDYPKDPVTPVHVATELAGDGLAIVLLVVGDGSLRSEVEAAARARPGAVRVLGHRSDVGRLLAASDAFVLTSKHEGLPFSLLEAMGSGLPAIVSDYPGAHDAVGESGIVVGPGAGDLRAAVRHFATDARQRGEIAARGRVRVADRFSSQRMLEATRQVYAAIRDE
jgi:glycosyltransferase involved in cell wall biosynthesis